MFARSRILARLLGFLGLLALIAGCSGGGGGPTPPGNHAPSITAINRVCCDPLAAGSLGYFIIDATDADGDELEYSLSAPEGNTLQRSTVRLNWIGWIAPDTPTDETITLTFTVSDGHGSEDTRTEDVNVAAPEAGNNAPTIESFTIAQGTIHAGEEVDLTLVANDLDGDTLFTTYDWWNLYGDMFENVTDNMTYVAPATVTEEHSVYIYVNVDDGHGNYVLGELSVTVVP